MNNRRADLLLDEGRVNVALQPHHQLISLVEATVFGSDGLRYRRLNVQSQLDRFCAPSYFHAMADNELVGVYVVDKRDLLFNGSPVRGYYRGVLAVDKTFQGMGVGKALTTSAMQWMADNAQGQPAISFGCIDQSNQRSLALLKTTGANVGASLSMYMMYGQWPSVRCKLDALSGELVDEARALANDLYADCAVRDVSASRLPGWICRDTYGIAISARVATTSFQITRMGGMAEWSTRLLVKPFAPARKRFDPDDFRYVSFSDVVIRPGCEKLWRQFVSTVLAKYQCHFGAVYVDPGSRLFTHLQKAQMFSSLLHSSKGSINVVWQQFHNASGAHIELSGEKSIVQLWPVDA
ncbi:MAG: GNAT family N-acetyltransferase [Granulosicoccus sp.]